MTYLERVFSGFALNKSLSTGSKRRRVVSNSMHIHWSPRTTAHSQYDQGPGGRRSVFPDDYRTAAVDESMWRCLNFHRYGNRLNVEVFRWTDVWSVCRTTRHDQTKPRVLESVRDELESRSKYSQRWEKCDFRWSSKTHAVECRADVMRRD